MKKPRRLTAFQERRLSAALSVDDLLYRKFQKLQADLYELRERIILNPCHVREVIGLRKDGVRELLAIEKIEVLPEGTRVTVRIGFLTDIGLVQTGNEQNGTDCAP